MVDSDFSLCLICTATLTVTLHDVNVFSFFDLYSYSDSDTTGCQ